MLPLIAAKWFLILILLPLKKFSHHLLNVFTCLFTYLFIISMNSLLLVPLPSMVYNSLLSLITLKLTLSQIWLLGSPGTGSYVLLTGSYQFVSSVLLSGISRYFRIILYLSCSSPETNHLSKELLSFLVGLVLKTKMCSV